MQGYLIASLDPGGAADPAAIVVAHIVKPDRLTKARVLHLGLKHPVVTAQMHVDLVQTTMTKIFEKLGPRAPVRYVVDISNNSAIAYLLAQVLPRASLIGIRITASEQHGAGLQPLMVGDVGGKAMSIPVMNLSRRQLLLDVGVGFSSGQLTLPREDFEQAEKLQELKRQMARASLKTTPSGKSVAVVQRGHDDLLMALAQLWAATKLPPPREAREPSAQRTHQPGPTAAGWT